MNRRILVVDDEQMVRSLLQEMLEDEGYTVEMANDGVMAWEKLALQPERYGAILLDMEMPRMNGLQLLQVLREQQRVVARAVIAVSCNSGKLHQALTMGASCALEKPFDLETVLAVVAQVVSQHTNLAHSQ